MVSGGLTPMSGSPADPRTSAGTTCLGSTWSHYPACGGLQAAREGMPQCVSAFLRPCFIMIASGLLAKVIHWDKPS